ncbi:hypothetical protein XM53_15050 [Roseovarius atlanticus]|uniref:Uncharacterized protein n=1 Tax=Roseovarius atlanticus TaxID=1641875 RepID=A0A0T5NRQ8_9RHOB|nr:hypothetical protein XM53_15050 [Roseovarius atlanticus]
MYRFGHEARRLVRFGKALTFRRRGVGGARQRKARQDGEAKCQKQGAAALGPGSMGAGLDREGVSHLGLLLLRIILGMRPG